MLKQDGMDVLNFIVKTNKRDRFSYKGPRIGRRKPVEPLIIFTKLIFTVSTLYYKEWCGWRPFEMAAQLWRSGSTRGEIHDHDTHKLQFRLLQLGDIPKSGASAPYSSTRQASSN